MFFNATFTNPTDQFVIYLENLKDGLIVDAEYQVDVLLSVEQLNDVINYQSRNVDEPKPFETAHIDKATKEQVDAEMDMKIEWVV